MQQNIALMVMDRFRRISVINVHGVLNIGAKNILIFSENNLRQLLDKHIGLITKGLPMLDINVTENMFELKIVIYAKNRICSNGNFIAVLKEYIENMLDEIDDIQDTKALVNIDGSIENYKEMLTFRFINKGTGLIGELNKKEAKSIMAKINNAITSMRNTFK